MHDLSVVCLYTATLSSTIALGQPETRMNDGTLVGVVCNTTVDKRPVTGRLM
jgi:acid phosphatase class B